jgi:hypothetical protein
MTQIEAGVDAVCAVQSKGHRWEMRHSRAVNATGFLTPMALSGSFPVLYSFLAGIR